MFKKLALAGLLLGLGAMAKGDDLESNPYVVLYKNRVEMAKAAVEEQKWLISFAKSRYDRSRLLFERNATSREEVQGDQSSYEAAISHQKEMILHIAEAENLLNVTRVRIAAGQDMPICTPYQ